MNKCFVRFDKWFNHNRHGYKIINNHIRLFISKSFPSRKYLITQNRQGKAPTIIIQYFDVLLQNHQKSSNNVTYNKCIE